MPKANLGDVEIFYETHGVGAPVLLVPGLGGVGAYWNPNVEAFSEKHQVITHDHRGTGQSSRSRIRYSVDRMSDDLLRLMDHLGIERAHLVPIARPSLGRSRRLRSLPVPRMIF
jgi:aminoacrylate hydrolase